MFKEIKYFFLLKIIPPFIYLFMKFIRATSRVSCINEEGKDEIWGRDENSIVCFWHGRLLMMPFIYKRGRGKVLVSRHRDGEFITKVIGYFGLGTIRGSYRKGGISTSREILRALKGGYDVAITPDGPKGPRYMVKGGIVELARLTGRPLLPVTYSASRKRIFNSWDKFLLPYPFSRIVYIWGDPIYVVAGDEERRREELEKTLMYLTEEADRIVCGG